MAILFAGGGEESVTRLNQSIGSTDTAYFDNTYGDGIFVVFGGAGTYAADIKFASQSGTIWLHGLLRTDATGAVDTTQSIFEWRGSGAGRFRLKTTAGNATTDTYQPEYWNGSAWTSYGGTFTIASAATGSKGYLDVALVPGGSGSITVYWNEVQTHSYSASLTLAGDIDTIRLNGPRANGIAFSQIVVADGNTVGMRVYTCLPNAAGTHTEWTGAYTALDDQNTGVGGGINVADFISSNTVNQRTTVNMGAPGAGLYSGSVVAAVVVSSALERASGSSVADVQHMIRTASTDYTSASLGVPADGARRPYQTIYATNPNTSVAWTQSDIAALETGVKAV